MPTAPPARIGSPFRPTSPCRALLASACLAVAAAAQIPSGGSSAPGPGPVANRAVSAQIAGRSLTQFPWFDHVDVFFENGTIRIGLDPTVHTGIAGQTADVYVVAHQPPAFWDTNPALIDVRGAPQSVAFGSTDVQSCTFVLTGALSGDAGTTLGVGYDLLVDMNTDGRADPGDLLDGYGEAAGFYVCKPTGDPGPLAVTEVIYNGGTFLLQDLYYPTNIASLGELPLVIVSHGNGHNYQWYDHIGFHLASWGYVVMSHSNDTMPGIETASTTTLTNTQYLLANLATIAGGVLNGHVDRHNIVWIGHSRGGEGICRAYDRVFDGTFVPNQFVLSDIRLLSSIAPTDFLGTASANPHDANHHLWVGGADADVTGCASSDIVQSFPLTKRSTAFQQTTQLHGAGHGDFHANTSSSSVASGPCLLGRADTHKIMKAYLLPLVKRYTEGSIPAREFLWRQWETFQSPGMPTTACAVVDLQYIEPPSVGKRVIDDFQTMTATNVSSSGGAVTGDVGQLNENRLDDPDTVFNYALSQPFNGMTEAIASDVSRGAVFQWGNANLYLDFEVLPAWQDMTGFTALSFRACQSTRAPETTSVLGDLDFDVVLIDGGGNESSIRVAAYGGGIEEPYQRSGSCGATGAGWNNEWETVRIRLADFTRNGTVLDLADVASVRFRFGPAHGAASGRIGLDDVEFLRN
jgi:hypothetical protein